MAAPPASSVRERSGAGWVARAGAPAGGPGFAERHAVGPVWPLLLGCVLLATLSLLLPAAPTYDPWAWLVWGREITELDLNTRLGPSWKPLPVMFTTVFALFGERAPDLWLVVARSGGLLALAMAYRLATRLAGRFAGVMAAAGVLLMERWMRDSGLAHSEPLLVGLVLWSIDAHLGGRHRRALGLGFAAGLLRPEIWPFLGLYGLFLWFGEPRLRRVMVALALLMPMAWFLPELWGSGNVLRASERARTPNPDSPAFAERPALEILELFWPIVVAPVKVGALIGVAIALVAWLTARRDGATLVVAGAGIGWLALVAVMTEAGYAGNVRYLMVSAALMCVVAGVGFGRSVELVRARVAPSRSWAGLAVAAALVLAAGALALPRMSFLAGDGQRLLREAELYEDIPRVVARAGGRDRLLDCGQPFTGPYQVPSIAWYMHVHTGTVTHVPPEHGVAFRPAPGSGEEPRFPMPPVPPFERVASSEKWNVLASCDPDWPRERRSFETSAAGERRPVG